MQEGKPVCRFWKQGHCRFGKDCKFSHVDDSGPSHLSSNNGRNNFNNNSGSGNSNATNNFRNNNNNRLNKHNPFLLDKDAIKADLTAGEEKPQWPLSAYGPGRDAPQQLIAAPYEVSPEEMRVQCYLARANGQFEQYVNSELRLGQEAGAEAARILGNIDEAIKFVQEGETRDDNRRTQVTKNSGDFPRQSQAFGQPSQIPPPNGLSSFGHTSHANQNPAFPSHLGSQGAFQKPQQATLGGAPSFGQPTAIGTSAFGRPSEPAFGQPSQPTSTFGQPSQQGQSTFGQPSQPSHPTFGQPSQPAPSTFGQVSQQNPSPFGQPSQQSKPAFGQPSQPSQSAFGQPSQPSKPAFGQPSQPAQSAFGQPSQPAQPAFSQPLQQASPFGAGSAQSQQSNGGSAFGRPSAPPTGPSQAQPQQARAPAQQAASSNHPGADPDAEGPPGAYEGQLGRALKDVYQAVYETGRFGDLVPEIPPKREWVKFPA